MKLKYSVIQWDKIPQKGEENKISSYLLGKNSEGKKYRNSMRWKYVNIKRREKMLKQKIFEKDLRGERKLLIIEWG